MKKLLSIMTLLVAMVTGAWADSKEFVAGTNTGQFSQSTEITDSPVTLKTSSIGGNANSRQIWVDGSSAKNETAVQLSSGAGNDPSSKFIEVSVSEGYKITGLTVRGASNGSDADKVTFKGFCFSGAYSDAVGGITAVGDLVFPLKTGTSSDAANVSMTGIAENTRTIRIYKNVKYNSTTMQMGNVSGASSTPSAENLNVAKITVTYAPTATQYAITWANGGHGTAPTTPTSASVFTLPTMDDADGYKNTGWTANQAVTVGGVEQAAGTELAVGTSVTLSAATTFTGVWTALATNITVTFDKGEGEGVAPAALSDQTEGSEITLPKNFTMYKEGYTLTGWNDGVNTYAPGASYTIPAADVTLTAVYTANTKSLAEHKKKVTVKWDFLRDNGAPAVAWGEGSGAHFWVAQADVDGETIDIKLPINVTASGKFNNSNNTDWVQINNTTEFTIPSSKDATISVYVYGEGDASTVNGNARDSYASSVSTYNITATDATAQLIIDKGSANSYYKYIQVVLPGETPVSGKMLSMEYNSGSLSGVDQNTEVNLATPTEYYTIDGGTAFLGNLNSTANKAQISSSNGVYFNGNDAYIKIELDYELKAGDVITFTNPDANNRQICFTTSKTRSDVEKTVSNSYTVGDALKGASTIYVWRAETGATYAKKITITRNETISTSSGNTYATYVTNSDLDFSSVSEDITAYIVTGISGEAVTTEAVTEVPANTAILVKTASAGASVSVPLAASAPAALSTNKLHYSSSEVAGDDTTIYGFFKVGEEYGFAPVASGTNLPARKAYLVVNAGSLNFLPINFGDVTAVHNVEAAPVANKAEIGKKAFVNGRLVIITENGVVNALGQSFK